MPMLLQALKDVSRKTKKQKYAEKIQHSMTDKTSEELIDSAKRTLERLKSLNDEIVMKNLF